jgi:PKD repeat protein
MSSAVYSTPISVVTDTTLRFFAVDTAGNTENVKTEEYVIGTGPDTTPPVTTADPVGGTYSSAVSVTLTSNEPATVYYTTDGREPTTSDYDGTGASPLSGIVISTDTTLKFFGVDTAGNEEMVKAEDYVITGSGNNPPTAAFSANPLFSYGPVTIDFDASASNDPDGDTLTYRWDFGDGQTSTGKTVSHLFSEEDVYYVTLTVTDTGGLLDSITKPVGVLETVGHRNDYLNPSDIFEIVINASHEHSDIVTGKKLGKTYEGRPIVAVKISDNPRKDESTTEPTVCFEGGIHAREPLSWEAPVDCMKYLLEKYPSDSQVKKWVDETEIWIVPCLNPDGIRYAIEGYKNWRKNRHGPGVDLNRNWHFMWDDSKGGSTSSGDLTYRGPYPDSEAETQSMLALNWRERWVFQISYHTYMTNGHIYYPYGTSDAAKAEPDLVSKVANECKSGGGIDSASYAPGAGGEIDTQLYEFGTICLAVELAGGSFWPEHSSGMAEVEKRRGAWQYLLDRAAGDMLCGTVTDTTTGEPIVARFHIDGINMTPNDDVPNCFTFFGEKRYSKPNGTYWKPLKAGSYTVTFSMDGYKEKTKAINVSGKTRLDVSLEKETGQNEKPTASFTPDTRAVKKGDTVTFDASGSSDPDGDSLLYCWTFGDGDRRNVNFNYVSTNPVYSFTFDVDPGTYLVILVVDDGNGASDKACTSIIVEE